MTPDSAGRSPTPRRDTLMKSARIHSAGEAKKFNSKEELLAEMGAAFHSATAGIVLR